MDQGKNMFEATTKNDDNDDDDEYTSFVNLFENILNS